MKNKTVVTTVRLPEEIYEQLRLEAFERRVTRTQIISEALAAKFEKCEKEG